MKAVHPAPTMNVRRPRGAMLRSKQLSGHNELQCVSGDGRQGGLYNPAICVGSVYDFTELVTGYEHGPGRGRHGLHPNGVRSKRSAAYPNFIE